MSSSLSHQARPRPTWSHVQHRFPAPEETAAAGGDNNWRARRLHMHIASTVKTLLDATDATNTDAKLSPEGRKQKVAAHGEAALASLAELDDPASEIGLLRVVLSAQAGEANQYAARAIAPDPARLPLLVTIANRLADADRPTRVRVVSLAIAALQNDPANQASRDTLAAVLTCPSWLVDLPEGVAAEAVTALRAAVAPDAHARAVATAGRLDHSARLRENAIAELRTVGIVVSTPHLVTSAAE
jgi:hypothetical protein